MELPIELFLGGMGISIALAIFGFLRQPQIPAMLCFGGMFMLVFAVATDTLIMGFFTDAEGTADVFHYNVQSSTGQVLINAVSSQTQAEYASSSSSLLVGDSIDCMTVWLGKAGTPPAGDISFAVFDDSNNIVTLFGTQTPASMASTALTPYTHCLPVGQTHTIQNQQRIGVNYNLGDAANTITMRVDANNPFDGVITYRTQYIAAWSASTGQDIMMQLYQRGADITTDNIVYEFTELPKTLFALMGSIFMLCGALMVLRNN